MPVFKFPLPTRAFARGEIRLYVQPRPHGPPSRSEGTHVPTSPLTARYYSATDLVALLNISITTVNEWTKTGRLPQPVQPGGPGAKRYWPVEAVQRMFPELNNSQPVASAE